MHSFFHSSHSIDVPHYQNINEEKTTIETPIPGVTRNYNATALAESLMARGHNVSETDMNSGLSMILVQDNAFVGGVDKRRDGTVGGSDEPTSETTSAATRRFGYVFEIGVYVGFSGVLLLFWM